jgi:hypothetical protein
VAACRKTTFLAMATLALCLPAALRAQTHVYEVSTGHAQSISHFEFAVTESPSLASFVSGPAGAATQGDWEVTVVYDPVRCGFSCSYRRKRDTSGRVSLAALLPPITFIRVYTEPNAEPALLVVDPAGLNLPFAVCTLVIASEITAIPGKGTAAIQVATDIGDPVVSKPLHALCATGGPAATVSAILSLRI